MMFKFVDKTDLEATVIMSADKALLDYGYAAPSCEVMKRQLNDAIDRQEELQRKLRNASLREQRTKKRCGTI